MRAMVILMDDGFKLLALGSTEVLIHKISLNHEDPKTRSSTKLSGTCGLVPLWFNANGVNRDLWVLIFMKPN